MPSYIVKVSPERDAYFEWSTVVDSPISFGTREDYIQEGQPEERLARADRQGTSANWPGLSPDNQPYGWNHGEFLLMNTGPEGHLPRARLGDLYDLFTLDSGADTPPEWIKPLEYDEED